MMRDRAKLAALFQFAYRLPAHSTLAQSEAKRKRSGDEVHRLAKILI